MKKIRIFLLVLFITSALFIASRVVLETDYLWHIKAGEYMFKHGTLTHDVFSWIVKGEYWMSHEWLFEEFIYILKLVFGNYHLIIYPIITILPMLLLIYIPNRDKFSKNIFYTLVFSMFLFMMMISYVQVRPHLLGFLFLTITIYLLYDLYKNEDSKKIYILPFITMIWANAHGGSSNLSYILCLLFFIGGLFSFKFTKIEAKKFTKKQILTYLIMSIICMISICVNIHGFKMFIYPYENMADTTMLNNITEWQSTSLNVISHYIYYIYLLFIIMTMLLSGKKIRFIDFILLGFVTFLGLKSIRFWIYSPIIMSFIIFDYVKEEKVSSLPLSIFSGILCGFIVLSIINIYNMKFEYKFHLDNEIIDAVKKERPKRLYNMYNYGGELIYNDIKVFVDGRADLYSKHNLKDYLNIANGDGDYVMLINKYNFDYLLVDKDYSIYTYLKYNDNYQAVYEKNKTVLYKKIVN